MDTEQHWWFCVKHQTVESDTVCPAKDRLGPYPTKEAAEHALETVRQRNEEWDARMGVADSGLPQTAQARLAEIKESGTWSSALTTEEFAAIKSVGFEPVGQVLGAAVYNMGWTGGYGCPSGYFGSYNRMTSGWRPGVTSLSSSGGKAMYAPLVQTMYAARRTAIDRMKAECAALGGHGVVGVRLKIGRFPAASGALEFHAIGTAVRAPGGVPLRQPFTSDLSGQDFAKLINDGVVPVSLVLGISVGARHDDWQTRSQTRWSAGNTEVGGYTELVTMTRHDARNRAGGRRRQARRRRRGDPGHGPADRRAGVPGPGGRPGSRRRGDDHRHGDHALQAVEPGVGAAEPGDLVARS